MIIFSKYSNERDERFRIRTDIEQEGGERRICKRPLSVRAEAHISALYDRYVVLQYDLRDTPLRVNPCTRLEKEVRFPYREGKTFEERLDALVAAGKLSLAEEEMGGYFAMFAGEEAPGCTLPFSETSEFREVFGHVEFLQPQTCRAVSDIDMVFSNVIETDEGPELIDYEWTFAFPVPVKYIVYRCLNYYVYGNGSRDALTRRNLFSRFGITEDEKLQFEKMEHRFQQYILGSYTPLWKLYDSISDGVIDISAVAVRESEKKRRRTVEIYFDDGRGFGAWNFCRHSVSFEGPVTLEIPLVQGLKMVRVDPCSGTSVLRLYELTQEGRSLDFTTNGMKADNGDFIFDTDDPQILFAPVSQAPVTIRFLAEPMSGLNREILLCEYGNLRWLTDSKAWREAKKLRRILQRKPGAGEKEKKTGRRE